MNHFKDSKSYYSNECGFFAGLGFLLLVQEEHKIKEHGYLFYLESVQENIFWYYKMAAHYGRLALKELDQELEIKLSLPQNFNE